MATIMKDMMFKLGIDLEEIRKDFFENGGRCHESIISSKNYIETVCRTDRKSIWDVVKETMEEIESDADNSVYQKNMFKASLLLAWEDMEKNNMDLVMELRNENIVNNN